MATPAKQQAPKKKKVTKNKKKLTRQQYPQEVKDKAIRLYKKGIKIAEIRNQLKLTSKSDGLVYNWLKAAGVDTARHKTKNGKPKTKTPQKRAPRRVKITNAHHDKAVQIFGQTQERFNTEIARCLKKNDYEGVALFSSFGRSCNEMISKLTGEDE